MHIKTIKLKNKEIILLNKIADCTFGEVYLCSNEGRNEFYATKIIGRNYIDHQFNECFQNEMEIIKTLKNPNICRYIDDIETPNHYYLVMEYINGGSLSDCLSIYQSNNIASFSEEIVQHIMKQIISAFIYIHSNKIIHRNINLDNIMVHFDNEKDKKDLNLLKAQIKIMDFSLALKGVSGKTILGSPLTMDPNLLIALANHQNKETFYDNKIDIWSIGAVCYEMLTGQTVYEAQSLDDLIKKAHKGSINLPTNLSSEAYNFLDKMLQFSPSKRLSAV